MLAGGIRAEWRLAGCRPDGEVDFFGSSGAQAGKLPLMPGQPLIAQRPHIFGVFGSFLNHFGSIWVPFCDHFGTILGPFWEHFGTILDQVSEP